MDFKKGNWKPDTAFNLDDIKNELDDKLSKNIAGDMRKMLPPGGFPSK